MKGCSPWARAYPAWPFDWESFGRWVWRCPVRAKVALGLLATLLASATPVLAQTNEPPPRGILLQPEHPRWKEQAPAAFLAVFETSRGRFVIEVQREWSPHGADRFYNLVRNGYYDGGIFHRVLPNYITQWGLQGDPAVNRIWKTQYILDDSVKQSNVRGFIGFAMTGPNLRATQVYINMTDNSRNDVQGFSPFGRVIEGMQVADSIYSGYGENSGGGLRGGKQGPVEEGGNAYLRREYPKLDSIMRARIAPAPRPR